MSNWEVEVNLRGVCRGVRARWVEGFGGAGHEIGCWLGGWPVFWFRIEFAWVSDCVSASPITSVLA